MDALSLANLMATVVACSAVNDALRCELSHPIRINVKTRISDVFIKCAPSRLTDIGLPFHVKTLSITDLALQSALHSRRLVTQTAALCRGAATRYTSMP